MSPNAIIGVQQLRLDFLCELFRKIVGFLTSGTAIFTIIDGVSWFETAPRLKELFFAIVSVFHQMLQALDYLAWKGIVHRDMKPENILYVSQPNGQYQFQLGDFGLCNRVFDAATFAGSRLYMAPEMFRKGGQIYKLDVWSLFVTILWTLDVGGFRQMSNQFESTENAQKGCFICSLKPGQRFKIQEMAIVTPEERASAAQMLVKYYNGVGLSTPRNQVPALTSSHSSKIAAARAPALAPPALTTRTAQTKLRPKNANIFTAAAKFRVEKAPAQPTRRLQELRGKPPVKS